MCQQNLINQHKYMVMTQQKYAASAKKNWQVSEMRWFSKKYAVPAKTCWVINCSKPRETGSRFVKPTLSKYRFKPFTTSKPPGHWQPWIGNVKTWGSSSNNSNFGVNFAKVMVNNNDMLFMIFKQRFNIVIDNVTEPLASFGFAFPFPSLLSPPREKERKGAFW